MLSNIVTSLPEIKNEPIYQYESGSQSRENLQKALKELKSTKADYGFWINGKEVKTGNLHKMAPPHETSFDLGNFHKGDQNHVNDAVNAALKAKNDWANMPWEDRAGIFLKAADLIAGPYRYKMNAATMLAQSKNAYQAEIDAVCELIDFLRFNIHFAAQI